MAALLRLLFPMTFATAYNRSADGPADGANYGITVDNVSVTYSNARLALYNASCYVQPGTITGLVGPNGGGKSTLFKSIMGFLSPSQGRVHFDDLSIETAQYKQLIAYVPQADEVDWNFPISVFDVVMMGRYGYMNIFRIPSRKDRRIVTESLERVGMSEFKHRQIGELSGGQKKRAFLARALAQEGKVILLDEPFSGIDIKTEAIMMSIFADLSERGKTLLVCSHEWGEALNRYHRLLLLNRRVLANDTPQAVMTIDNIQQAYGANIQSALNGGLPMPFVC